MEKLLFFDNGGETLDRYTIVHTPTGDMCGASEDPYHPMGFGQMVGNCADSYWITAYGHGWRDGCGKKLIRKRIRFAVNHLLSDYSHLGTKVLFTELPAQTRRYVVSVFGSTPETVVQGILDNLIL